MAKIGSLFVHLGLNTAEFNKNLSKSSKRVRRAGRNMRKSFKAVDKSIIRMTGLVAGLAGPAALGALVVSSLKTVDALAKTADKLGLTTEALAGLRFAGEQTGIETRTLDMALQRMTRRMAEAAKGTGEAKEAIKTLGLDAVALAAGSPDEAFRQIAGAMENVTNKSEKLRLAFKLFDSEGVALVNTLSLGTKGLEDMSKEAEALGLAVSRVNAKKIEEANDAITRVKSVLVGVGNTIAVKLSPFIKALADQFTAAAIDADGFKSTITTGFNAVITAVGFVADAFRGLRVVFNLLELAYQKMIELFLSGFSKLTETYISVRKVFNEDFQPPAFLKTIVEMSEFAKERTARLSTELDMLIMKPMPSDNIQSFMDEIVASAAVARDSVASITGGGDTGLSDQKRTQLEAGVEALRESLLSEEAALIESHERQLEQLNIAEQNKIDSILPFKQLREKLEEKHEKKLADIKKKGIEAKQKIDRKGRNAELNAMISTFQTASALMNSQSKKLFKIGKAAATATAILSAYKGIALTLGTYPYPWNLIAAAAHAVVAFQQISAIRSTTFGGGSAGVSVGGGGGVSTGTTFDGGAPSQSVPIGSQIDTTQQGVSLGDDQGIQVHVVVNLDGQPIVDEISRASEDGRLTIDAKAVA